MNPSDLVLRWRQDAEHLERYHDGRLAQVCRDHADALAAALRDTGDELLTLAQAARESGYHADRLRHLIADGTLANAGRKGAPRIRRADLPRKPTSRGADAFDATAAALRLTSRRDAA